MSASLRLLLLASTVVVLAAAVRIHAAGQLRQDWDEDNYFRPAQLYAAAIRAGDMGSMFRTPRTHAEVAAANLEHPPLPKLLFAVALMTVPPAPIVAEPSVWRVPRNDLPRDQFAAARSVSVALGVLGVAVLAVADPLAAVILATHTWHVKYTSEVMLEAPAALASLVAVLCYLRARTGSRRWVVLSGVAVGLTIASKYVYGLAAVAIVLDHALGSLRARSAAPSPPGGRGDAGRGLGRTRFRRAVAPLVLWAGVSVGAFVAVNPYLWSDPVQRLVASVRFHPTYAGRSEGTGGSSSRRRTPSSRSLRWPGHAGPGASDACS